MRTFYHETVSRAAERQQAELAGADELTALQREVSALREEIQALSHQPPGA
jgi:hypothetical protein